VLKKAWDALVAAFEGRRPELRFQAVASLAELDLGAALPFVERAVDDSDSKIRAQAAAILGDSFGQDLAGDGPEQHPPERPAWVSPALIRLTSDGNGEVSREAAFSLARIGDVAAIPTLVSALSGSRDPLLDAATALAGLARRHRAATPFHADALMKHLGRFRADPLVQVRLAEALAWQGDPRGRPNLERLAKTWLRSDVRGLAADVLASLP